MIKERSFESKEEQKIVIRRSKEAPREAKENPFYDPEIWGSAKSSDDIYLPESDEAISFALAIHEIGHLVKEGEIEASLDDFESTRAEEERAWSEGIKYIDKYLSEYYANSPGLIPEIKKLIEQIKTIMMEITDLSKDLYLSKGTLVGVSPERQEIISKERRQKLFREKEQTIKEKMSNIKEQKIGKVVDWDKFVEIVTKAVKDILKDNEK